MLRKLMAGLLAGATLWAAGCNKEEIAPEEPVEAIDLGFTDIYGNIEPEEPLSYPEESSEERTERLESFSSLEEAIDGHNRPDEERINVLFIGVNYTQEDFMQAVHETIDIENTGCGFASVEPFASNLNNFNFWVEQELTWVGNYEPSRSGNEAIRPAFLHADRYNDLPNLAIFILADWSFRSFAGYNLPEEFGTLFGYTVLSSDSSDSCVAMHEGFHSIGQLDDTYLEDDIPSQQELRRQERYLRNNESPNCYVPRDGETACENAPWAGLEETECVQGCGGLQTAEGRPIYRAHERDIMRDAELNHVGLFHMRLVCDVIDEATDGGAEGECTRFY